MKTSAAVAPALYLALFSSSATAAPSTLDARAAQQIIEGCAAHAKSRSQSHAIFVVDSGGHVVASLRMDGNSYGIGDFALQKAQAVAAWRFSTDQMTGAAKQTPGFGDAPHVVIVAGGVPVFTPEGDFIGAVGVSGEAPKDDAACAETGIKAAGLASSRTKR
jgi:glc operon protein GlcG